MAYFRSILSRNLGNLLVCLLNNFIMKIGEVSIGAGRITDISL